MLEVKLVTVASHRCKVLCPLDLGHSLALPSHEKLSNQCPSLMSCLQKAQSSSALGSFWQNQKHSRMSLDTPL